jgi:hypothetical protein
MTFSFRYCTPRKKGLSVLREYLKYGSHITSMRMVLFLLFSMFSFPFVSSPFFSFLFSFFQGAKKWKILIWLAHGSKPGPQQEPTGSSTPRAEYFSFQ